MIVTHVNYQDIRSERECFGKFDGEHKFCLNTCAIRFECEKKSKKVD